MALTPFGQWLQGWVPRLGRHHTDTPARIKKGLNAATVAGIGAGIGVASLGPWLAHLLGGSHVSVTFALAAFVGISVAMSTISRASGMAGLQTLGMSKAVAISAVVGAAIGIPLLLVSVPVYGAVGAAAAVAAAETGVTLAQGIRLRRVLAGIAAHG
ncbi:polysaccharide biosynthesis C-terminal domain-containing protein [Glaciihabitans sp. dw_435]|uniref:polysaccharide biosynthesis C-terminal domain-containing protein n=1 Tax=Glaciihabitans sp. dw_435 TaxID=2720081 RepID=UPI0035ABC5D2